MLIEIFFRNCVTTSGEGTLYCFKHFVHRELLIPRNKCKQTSNSICQECLNSNLLVIWPCNLNYINYCYSNLYRQFYYITKVSLFLLYWKLSAKKKDSMWADQCLIMVNAQLIINASWCLFVILHSFIYYQQCIINMVLIGHSTGLLSCICFKM